MEEIVTTVKNHFAIICQIYSPYSGAELKKRCPKRQPFFLKMDPKVGSYHLRGRRGSLNVMPSLFRLLRRPRRRFDNVENRLYRYSLIYIFQRCHVC